MKFIGDEPSDLTAFQTYVVQASRAANEQRWQQAIELLESAAIAMPKQFTPQVIDVLMTYYIKENAYRRIAQVLRTADTIFPSLAIGAMLVERSRRLGLPIPELPEDFYSAAREKLTRYLAEKVYNLEMCNLIQALAMQLGDVEIALPLFRQLRTKLPGGISEEMLTIMLSLLLEAGRQKDAMEIVNKLSSLPSLSASCVKRFEVLLGKTPLESGDADDDKLIAFLRRANIRHSA